MVLLLAVGQAAQAQTSGQVVWVQIEAQPNLRDGLARARDYARELDDVNGFALGGGWHGIVLGPYTAQDAEQVLQVYRAEGLIPRDSYIAFSSSLGEQFFPQGIDVLRGVGVTPQQPDEPQETPAAVPQTQAEEAPQAPAPVITAPDETPAQARQSERTLSADARRDLQIALKWAGFYNSTIDGAFGRGTRNSMSEWQRANGFEPTGILTTLQRATLLRQYNAVLEGLDLRLVTDSTTGIAVKIPTGVVALERYDPPFAQFNAVDGSNARVLLISQEGDSDTLTGLFQVMQTLEIVPLDGERRKEKNSFVLVGRNAEIISETRVQLRSGQIKGFTLIWPTGDEARRTRLLSEMEASFTRLEGVLDAAAGDSVDQQIDLVAGLQIRKPKLSRSGFYVDERGSVITTSDAVDSCTRITLDEEHEATPQTVDAARGLALLTPDQSLAPPQVAQFSPAPPRLQSEVAVAGYSYEGVLDAPTMTFGTLADLRGLRGEADLSRLTLSSLPGDAGGPVFDTNGNVLGMLLPRGGGARQLPEDVTFALAGSAIADVMRNAGLIPANSSDARPLAPEDITTRALGMTVLVSCWE
ncbi:serine protease [Roseobacter insulae]|nr:serine protease [Roseobacter insulae]